MIDSLQKMVVVSAVLAIVFTILLAPAFSALYRRRITRLMAHSSGAQGVIVATSDASTATRRPPLLVDAPRISPQQPARSLATRWSTPPTERDAQL